MAPCAHGGNAAEVAGRLGVPEASLLDFSVNLNPFISFSVEDALRRSQGMACSYPDNRYVRFRESAARFAGVRAENVVPGNGSTEIFRLVAECCIERGDVAAIPGPTFGEYAQQCRLFGARIRHVPLGGIRNGDYGLLDGSRIVFLCNPNNPDGGLMRREAVEGLVRHCGREDIVAIVDEAFIDLADPAQSVAGLVDGYDNLVVVRSLTKCFAVPGLRLGFGIAGAASARALGHARLTWNLGGIAAEAGACLMDDAGPRLGEARDLIRREREWLAGAIGEIRGLVPLPASANYFLVDVSGTGMASRELAARMLALGVVVRDCGSFQLPGHVRLAVRGRPENERLVAALRRAAGGPWP